MTYQTLVVKDTSSVNKWWKWSIVSLLFIVIASSLTTSISFHSLMLNFNLNCPTVSKIRYKNYNVSESESTEPSTLSHPTTQYKWEQLRGNLLQSLSRKMREHIDNRRNNEETTPDPLARMLKYMDIKESNKEIESKRRQTLDEEDTEFFDSQFIDEPNTIWGSAVYCDYLTFIPLIAAIVAAVWLVMFLMCGNGGQSKHSFVEEAWRIVVPATTFFIVMSIIATVHLYLILSRLNEFCDALKIPFNDQTIGCDLLLDRFSINVQVDPTAGKPSRNHFLSVFSTWLNLVLWSATVVVMMLRCFYGTDFELVDMPPPMDYHIQSDQIKHNGKKRIDVNDSVEDDRSMPHAKSCLRDVLLKDDIEYGTMTKYSRIEDDDFTAAELCVPENNIGPMTAMSAWPQQPERRKLINEVTKIRETALNA